MRPLLPLLLCGLLSACGPGMLDFRPSSDSSEVQAASLLTGQRVPPALLLSVEEAVRRAPDGSVLVVCNARQDLTHFWGVCSHISRKLGTGLITDSPGFAEGGVQTRPESVLYRRHAVIVLDVGVTPAQLPALRAEAARLDGTPYAVAGTGDHLDCTTYQNALQHALGLPDVASLNLWNLWLPQDALTGPAMRAGGRVLWVGMEGAP